MYLQLDFLPLSKCKEGAWEIPAVGSNVVGVAWTSANHIISCSIFTRMRMKIGNILFSSTCHHKVRWCHAYSHKSSFARQMVLFLKRAWSFAQQGSYTMWAELTVSRLNCRRISNFSTSYWDLHKTPLWPNSYILGFLILFFGGCGLLGSFS